MDVTPLYNISFPGKEAVTMLDKLPLNGKKTYVVAGLTVLYCVCGLLLGEIPTNEALMLIAGALGITTIGHKIDKSPASDGRSLTNHCDRFRAALFLDQEKAQRRKRTARRC